ncbi:expressed unknown protein [Seminavis robusta]|uniref:Uncharacterized protein n=1 Tax=Seminavis robusta TaxID=568900 RepID=A0A9N8HX93_9STRA|nr:expressed unknown protein [Seminavis robusta]|eukprot:Sro2419_g327080.1 n/a (111) ;mRNA; r:8088-8420
MNTARSSACLLTVQHDEGIVFIENVKTLSGIFDAASHYWSIQGLKLKDPVEGATDFELADGSDDDDDDADASAGILNELEELEELEYWKNRNPVICRTGCLKSCNIAYDL